MFGFLKRKPKPKFEFPSRTELEVPPEPPAGIEAPPDIGEHELPAPEGPVTEPAELTAGIQPYSEEAWEEPEGPEMAPMERAVEPEAEEVPEVHPEGRIKLGRPVYIKVELFREVINEINKARAVFKDADEAMGRALEFKYDEDKEFNKLHTQFLDIQRKLTTADQILFE